MTGCRECGAPVKRIEDGIFRYQPQFCQSCSQRIADAEAEAEKARAIDAALTAAGATPRIRDWSLQTYPREHGGAQAVEAATEWVEAYRTGGAPNLYLWGKPGSGKTGLAWGIVREVLRDEYRAAKQTGLPMRNAAALIDVRQYLADTRGQIRGERGPAQRASTVPLAVLDDLGAERETAWAVETIGLVVAARYENLLPTIVTSNYSPEALADRLGGSDDAHGARILSRLCSGATVLELAANDRRFVA